MLARKVDWVELDEEAVWAAGPLPKVVLEQLQDEFEDPPAALRPHFDVIPAVTVRPTVRAG
jgi:hypothetical protein